MNKNMINISPAFILALLFATLKVSGLITWSWWWVLSPLWIPWVIAFAFMIGILIFAAFSFIVIAIYDSFNNNKRR